MTFCHIQIFHSITLFFLLHYPQTAILVHVGTFHFLASEKTVWGRRTKSKRPSNAEAQWEEGLVRVDRKKIKDTPVIRATQVMTGGGHETY